MAKFLACDFSRKKNFKKKARAKAFATKVRKDGGSARVTKRRVGRKVGYVVRHCK